MTTWATLDTRKGQLLEMAQTLSDAVDRVAGVMGDFPEEAHGSAWLEEAIALIARAESEIDAAASALD